MANFNRLNQDIAQFGSAKPANTGGSAHCAQCEAMLTDALDGTLTAEEQTLFDQHMSTCMTCQGMLADAQRGAAWLALLRTSPPVPSAGLLDRIIAQTSGQTIGQANAPSRLEAGASSSQTNSVGRADISPTSESTFTAGPSTGSPFTAASPGGAIGPRPTATILPFPTSMAATLRLKSIGHAMLQPRLAMTAAMAFFSIGLTLNLTGIRLNEIHASDLKPSSVRRGFYQANAHVVRYVDNLRAVYELESRVRDLQRSSDDGAANPNPTDKVPAGDGKAPPENAKPDSKQPHPRSGSGTSRRQGLALPAVPVSLAAWHPDDVPLRSLLCIPVASTSSTLPGGQTV